MSREELWQRQADRREKDEKLGPFRAQWRVEELLDKMWFGIEIEGEEECELV